MKPAKGLIFVLPLMAAACGPKTVALRYVPDAGAPPVVGAAPRLFVTADARAAKIGTELGARIGIFKPFPIRPDLAPALKEALETEARRLGMSVAADPGSADGVLSAQLLEAVCYGSRGGSAVAFRLHLADKEGRRFGQAIVRGHPGTPTSATGKQCGIDLNGAFAKAVGRVGEVIRKDGWLEKLAHRGAKPRESGVAYPWTGVGKPPRIVVLPVADRLDSVRIYKNGEYWITVAPTAAAPFEKALLDQLAGLGLEPAASWSEADWMLRAEIRRARFLGNGVGAPVDLAIALRLEDRSGRTLWDGTVEGTAAGPGWWTAPKLEAAVAQAAVDASARLGDVLRDAAPAAQEELSGFGGGPAAGSGPDVGGAIRTVDNAIGLVGGFIPGFSAFKSVTSKAARAADLIETGQAVHGAVKAVREARRAGRPEPEPEPAGDW